MSISYREFPPAAELASSVACYWRLSGVGSDLPDGFRILPDGCIDLVFCENSASPAVVVGPLTRSMVVPFSGNADFFGVRFRPGAAYSLFNLPLKELSDTHLELGELWRDSNMLIDRVVGISLSEQIRAVEELLGRRSTRLEQPDARISAAVLQLTHCAGNLDIQTLSAGLNISRQHLTRLFTDQVGVSPKIFARTIRFRKLLKHLEESSAINWAAVALDFGYYDQAHMIADFRELTGLTPTELCREEKR